MTWDRSRVWSLSRRRRALALAVAATSLLMLPSTSSAEPGPYPGIPNIDLPADFPALAGDRNIESWLNGPLNGLAGSPKALQWARIPLGALASNTVIATCGNDLNPCPFPVPDGTQDLTRFSIVAFLVSPEGSAEPYGFGQIATVRTVAFGSIPAEVGIQVVQSRDSDNLPVPLDGLFSTRQEFIGGQNYFVSEAGTITGQVSVRVVSLRLDGVDVGLSGACESGTTPLSLSSERLRTLDAEHLANVDPRKHFYQAEGGGVSGKLDIPPFGPCGTDSGDDIGPILTSVLSGPDNDVSAQFGALFCLAEFTPDGFPLPTPPGADSPAEAGCSQYQLQPDVNPDLWAIPLPWDIPDYAPGATAP